ncbi:MAG: DsrE family protein [Hyphomonas sp.]|nr:DsrE family protein [Hyphomonas sp.]
MFRAIVSLSAAMLLSAPALAGPDDFKPGPAIPAYGKVASVPEAERLSKDAVFKIAFDTSVPAEPGKVNRTLESAARFLNMHEAVGIPASNIKMAIVVHGGASADLVAGPDNANAPLVAALLKNRVRIILCGQTAAYRDIAKADLLPGVEIYLSAMTAHAQLQQDGYTLNPF